MQKMRQGRRVLDLFSFYKKTSYEVKQVVSSLVSIDANNPELGIQ